MPPASTQRLFTRLSRRFALLVVLGTAIVAAPLAEVWRRQGLELKVAFDARRALEAVTLAAHAQRAFGAHRPYAAAVLSGRSEQEPERLRRQQAVDGEVGALVANLESLRLHRALDEADQLRAEWAGLLVGIGRRQIPVAKSDATHELLHEQAFVIMDLAAAAGGLHGQTGRALAHEQWTLALRTLPQYTGALAALMNPLAAPAVAPATTPLRDATGPTAPTPKALPAARRVDSEAGLALAALDAAGADAPAPSPALVRALVALRQGAAALAESAAASATGMPAQNVARRAQVLGFDAHAALVTHLDSELAESITVLRRERLLVAIAGLLAAFVGALAALRVLPRRAAPAEESIASDALARDASRSASPDARAGQGGAESQGPASDLIERLRRRSVEAEASSAIAPKPTEPPEPR